MLLPCLIVVSLPTYFCCFPSLVYFLCLSRTLLSPAQAVLILMSSFRFRVLVYSFIVVIIFGFYFLGLSHSSSFSSCHWDHMQVLPTCSDLPKWGNTILRRYNTILFYFVFIFAAPARGRQPIISLTPQGTRRVILFTIVVCCADFVSITWYFFPCGRERHIS